MLPVSDPGFDAALVLGPLHHLADRDDTSGAARGRTGRSCRWIGLYCRDLTLRIAIRRPGARIPVRPGIPASRAHRPAERPAPATKHNRPYWFTANFRRLRILLDLQQRWFSEDVLSPTRLEKSEKDSVTVEPIPELLVASDFRFFERPAGDRRVARRRRRAHSTGSAGRVCRRRRLGDTIPSGSRCR